MFEMEYKQLRELDYEALQGEEQKDRGGHSTESRI